MKTLFKLFSTFVVLSITLISFGLLFDTAPTMAQEPTALEQKLDTTQEITSTMPFGTDPNDQSQLFAIANEAVSTQLDALTAISKTKRIYHRAYSRAIEKQLLDQVDMRNYLLEHALVYTGYSTTLTVNSLVALTNTVVMTARVHVVLNVSIVPNPSVVSSVVEYDVNQYNVNHDDLSTVNSQDLQTPKTSEYIDDHVFTFGKQNSEWLLISDELANPLGTILSDVPEVTLPQKLGVFGVKSLQVHLIK